MPKGHNEIKARHHAHEIRRRLVAAGLDVSMGHVYEALAADQSCLSYTEWRGRGWPMFNTGDNPSMFVVIRMTGLKYPTTHGDLIAKVVHDVLNGKESTTHVEENDQPGRPDPGRQPQ